MKIAQTKLEGVVSIEPRVFSDSRGFFMESWHQGRYGDAKLPSRCVQDNISHSMRGVLRGLHFQNPNPQGKLVLVAEGEIYDVCVDIRRKSPTFGQWVGIHLSFENKLQFYVPPGLAHGFCVLSEKATVLYKCTDFYSPQSEHTLLWNDPVLGIQWPIKTPLVSEKDQKGVLLKDIREDYLLPF